MGSSAKKKKEKNKDFQKPKLKVGKTRPKASNFTDTSFKSKSIVVKQQSLSTSAPSLSTQFSHHLSLLSSRSDNQRRDALSYLKSSLGARPVNAPLPQPLSVLLPKLLPLFLDPSNIVRDQLLKLLYVLPPKDMEGHVEKLHMYIRAGMNHIASEIRRSSLDILSWTLGIAGEELVSCPGGWVMPLQHFMCALGWSTGDDTSGPWSFMTVSSGKPGIERKAFVKCLNVLASFLQIGLVAEPGAEQELDPKASSFPLRHVQHHMLPKNANCFAQLNLFGASRDQETQMYEDREARQGVFHLLFRPTVERGLKAAKREGGEVGRAAATVRKILIDGMNSFDVATL